MSVQVFDERILISQSQIFDNPVGTNQQVLLQGQAYGSRMDVLLASNTDVIDHVLVIQFYGSGMYTELGSVNIPAGTGVGGVKCVDVIGAIFPTTITSFPIPDSQAVYAFLEVGATVAGYVAVTAVGGKF
jgi:hypothetical protein